MTAIRKLIAALIHPAAIMSEIITESSQSSNGFPVQVQYSLDENDHLLSQLYTASHSARIKNTRQRNRWSICVIYLIVAAAFLGLGYSIAALILAAFAMLWYFLYPFRERKRFISHYTAFIKEHYVHREGKISTLIIDRDFIRTSDTNGNESKISVAEIKEISEIGSYFFIRMKSGPAAIIPKAKIGDVDAVRSALQQLTALLKINYNSELDWQWK